MALRRSGAILLCRAPPVPSSSQKKELGDSFPRLRCSFVRSRAISAILWGTPLFFKCVANKESYAIPPCGHRTVDPPFFVSIV